MRAHAEGRDPPVHPSAQTPTQLLETGTELINLWAMNQQGNEIATLLYFLVSSENLWNDNY